MSAVDITTVDELRKRIGENVTASEWLVVSQERIDRFANATDDHQWLHVDVERARRESPFGTTIAHGFLTLSLISVLLRETVSVGDVSMAVNYGLGRVRFAAPVPAGSRIRARFAVRSVEPHRDGTKVVWNVVVERDSDEKTCCVADWIVLYHGLK